MLNQWRAKMRQEPRRQMPVDRDPHRQGGEHFTGAHRHSTSVHAHVSLSRRVKRGSIIVLLGVAVATVFGLISLWPNPALVDEMLERAEPLGGGVTTVRGEVLSVQETCNEGEADAPSRASSSNPNANEVSASNCVDMRVGLLSGVDAGRLVTVQVAGPLANAGVRSGDTVELVATERFVPEGADSAPLPSGPTMDYALAGVDRTMPLVLLGLLFAGVVIAVGRWRGVFALAALGVSGGVLAFFVLPGLVAGGPGLLIGMVGSITIMFVTLFFVHGPNMRTAAALVGTLFGILFVSGISMIAVSATRLSGVGDEASGVLSGLATDIDLRGFLTCSILIAGLGVLNDITIAQASSVWELRAAAPHLTRRELYLSAMRIGRDHIASTVYTVVFAYVGAALSVLILLYLLNVPMLALLTREDIVTEVVRTLCGSVGLVLAVPVTTAVATWFVMPDGDPQPAAESLSRD
ncbi:YibE/F family protein [Leucobacter sp. W1478]|uniref:YibE/F family protein n=1 Tax=Leucobacter sp. W1478 TaxID=3439065 RepID=UPI003F3F866E